MQNNMQVDTLPPAIVYDTAKDLLPQSGAEYRGRSESVHSNVTTGSETDLDPDIAKALLELEVSDSPNISIRKKIT